MAICDYFMTEWVLPDEGSRVPTNTRIWVYSESLPEDRVTDDDFSLGDESGTNIRISVEHLTLGKAGFERGLYVVTPTEPLTIGTRYELTIGFGYSLTRFVVSEQLDTDPPRAPVEVSRTELNAREDDSSCKVEVRIEYELEQPTNELMVMALDGIDDFDAERRTGTLFNAASHSLPDEVPIIRFGQAPNAGWPESNPKSVLPRVGTFDLAGNFSGWRKGDAVDRPKRTSGCSMVASGMGRDVENGYGMFALAWMAIAGRRRVKTVS